MEEKEKDRKLIMIKIYKKIKEHTFPLKKCKFTPFLFLYVVSCLLDLQDFNFSSKDFSFFPKTPPFFSILWQPCSPPPMTQFFPLGESCT